MLSKSIINITYIVAIATIISGCSNGFSNDERHARTYETRHPITLEHQNNSLELPIDVNQTSISGMQEAKIKGFLYKYNQDSKSNLIITVPESGMKASAARMTVKSIVNIVENIGINEDNILIGTYRPLNDDIASIRLNFESITAKAPDCSNMWSENLADTYNNELSKGHGCSTRKNLAAMIARPEDLVRMPTMSPGHAGRRTSVFDKYVLGQSTTAAKGETASATAE